MFLLSKEGRTQSRIIWDETFKLLSIPLVFQIPAEVRCFGQVFGSKYLQKQGVWKPSVLKKINKQNVSWNASRLSQPHESEVMYTGISCCFLALDLQEIKH